MNKIKVTSFYVARLSNFLVFAIPVFIIFQWALIDVITFLQNFLVSSSFSSVTTPEGIVNLHNVSWTNLTKIIGCCAQLIEASPFIGIFWYLSQLFYCYENDKIFTMQNAQNYYKIGKLLLFDAFLAQPISGGLWLLAVTLSNPVGQRYISISLGSSNFVSVFAGLFIILISWVMIEGSKIQDEQ